MLRYIFKLAQRDISLVHCMIPLGSCTMKLNATAEMMPITWPELNRIHPFAPAEQTQGYAELITSFEDILCEITGFPGMSLQVRGAGLGFGLGARSTFGKMMKAWPGPRNHRPFSKSTLSFTRHVHVS